MAGGAFPRAVALADDAEALARVGAGQASGLSDLMGRHRAQLLRFTTGMLGSIDRAEDVVQETFVRVWQHRSRWSRKGSVKSLLFRIARNLALNEERHGAVHREWARGEGVREPRSVPTPADELRAGELRRALHSALAAMPPRRREVFELARFHGLSHREIADRLGISPQTVANQMTAAVRDLKDALGAWLD